MRKIFFISQVILLCLILTVKFVSAQNNSDPLPSWNDTKIKTNIIDFVKSITDVNNKLYVKPYDRIATFDNAGCLYFHESERNVSISSGMEG